jgi:hypothetical protein
MFLEFATSHFIAWSSNRRLDVTATWQGFREGRKGILERTF